MGTRLKSQINIFIFICEVLILYITIIVLLYRHQPSAKILKSTIQTVKSGNIGTLN